MSRSVRRRARRAFAGIALLLGACQPLPHPFLDDRPPAALLRVRDVIGVSIAPVDGAPRAVAAKLGTALAAALLKRDILASEKTGNLSSFQLYGRVVEASPRGGKAAVTAYWRLYDAKGRSLGERTAVVEASTKEWETGSDAPLQRLAQSSADGIAPLVEDEAPVEAAAAAEGARRTRIVVRNIGGAPGDGAKSLAAAVKSVLQRRELAVVEPGQPADLYVDADIVVAPAQQNKQHIKITWHVGRQAESAEIGTVGMENDVPRGLLDGPWGDLAYNIALAAGDGLSQLIARAGPPPKP
jgi:hypothetical protein